MLSPNYKTKKPKLKNKRPNKHSAIISSNFQPSFPLSSSSTVSLIPLPLKALANIKMAFTCLLLTANFFSSNFILSSFFFFSPSNFIFKYSFTVMEDFLLLGLGSVGWGSSSSSEEDEQRGG
uniref:Uncharacterized protein n=1 Tax=Cacopsylla melanoneura TaxID=428564 RepID=A0A8D9B804_9HEMI